MTAVEAQTRASSSTARMKESASAPDPPYSSGTIMPRIPISARPARTSRGKRSSRSRSATPGAISLSAKSRTASRMRAWSSVSSKFMESGAGPAEPEGAGHARTASPAPAAEAPSPASSPGGLSGRRRSAGTGRRHGPAAAGQAFARRLRGRRCGGRCAGRRRPTEGSRAGPRAFPGRRGLGGVSSRGAARACPPIRPRDAGTSRRSRAVPPARAGSPRSSPAVSPTGSPVSAGIRSASKSTMRVQQTRFVRPSGASSSITKRSRSWSSVCSRYVELRQRLPAEDLQELEVLLASLERLFHRDHAVPEHACLRHR